MLIYKGKKYEYFKQNLDLEAERTETPTHTYLGQELLKLLNKKHWLGGFSIHNLPDFKFMLVLYTLLFTKEFFVNTRHCFDFCQPVTFRNIESDKVLSKVNSNQVLYDCYMIMGF